MKKIQYVFILFLLPLVNQAQPKAVSQAIVYSKTEISFPQNFNRPGGDNDNLSDGPTGMESKSTVYVKGDKLKTVNQSDFGNSITIIDKTAKTTTTLIEAMGRKTGYTVSDAEQEEVQKRMEARMDSIRMSRGDRASANNGNGSGSKTELIETNETKTIADYTCKKAIIKNTNRQGETNETIIWYTPDLKMPEGYPVTGSPMGGRGFGGRRGGFINTAELAKINGFVMGFEMARPNGFSMKMQVTKIQLSSEIADKVFDVPKGYEMKTAQEVQNMFLPRRNDND